MQELRRVSKLLWPVLLGWFLPMIGIPAMKFLLILMFFLFLMSITPMVLLSWLTLTPPSEIKSLHTLYVSCIMPHVYFLICNQIYRSPIAHITPPISQIGTKPAPFMAAFSSKGPNRIAPEILKVSLFTTHLAYFSFF